MEHLSHSAKMLTLERLNVVTDKGNTHRTTGLGLTGSAATCPGSQTSTSSSQPRAMRACSVAASFPVSNSGPTSYPICFPNQALRTSCSPLACLYSSVPTDSRQSTLEAFSFLQYKTYILPYLPLSLCQMGS